MSDGRPVWCIAFGNVAIDGGGWGAEGGGHSATSRLVYRERFGVAINMKGCSINAVRFVVRRLEFVGMLKVLDALNDNCSIRENPFYVIAKSLPY